MKLFDRSQQRNSRHAQAVEDLVYEAHCPSGHLITGNRQESFQAIRCPECSEGIFVLPTSRLPVPPTATIKKMVSLSQIRQVDIVDNSAPDDDDDEPVEFEERTSRADRANIELSEHRQEVDDSDLSDDPAADYPVEQGREVSANELAKIAREDLKKKEAARQHQLEAEQERRNATNGRRKRKSQQQQVHQPDDAGESDTDADFDDDEFDEIVERKPFLKRVGTKVWIGLGVVLVISLTVFFQLRQQHRERLPHVAQLGRTEGLTLLKSGKFDEAKKILGEAAAAYEEMGDRTEVAREIIQASHEAAIFADLAGHPLDEMLDRYAAGGEGEAEFNALDKNRSIIIESRINKTPDDGGIYDLDYRIAIGPGPDSARPPGRIDVSGLSLLKNLKPSLGDQVLIGARITGFELKDGEWLVKLDPESGVLMTNWDALGTIGWPVSDRPEAQAAIAEQENP